LNRRPKGIVIHHTTQPNTSDASLAHAFRIARDIQNFHMGPQRRWIDTGQHFTVSRGGHVLEGRHQSLQAAIGGRQHVLGAHAGEVCNSRYVGIENEGTYISQLPPNAQWQSLVQLCAWLCNQYGMNTADIIGHWQCKSTECPGDAFFAALPQLRRDVDAARQHSPMGAQRAPSLLPVA
jgi:N-acetyl-anhydromuramyl-L-alanine amidase AmpD